MSAELQSALTALSYSLIGLISLVSILVIFKVVGLGKNDAIKVTLAGEATTKLKGEVTTAAADNIYTERSAGRHTKTAELNLRAQEVALKAAEANERTEAMRLERTRLENPGANA